MNLRRIIPTVFGLALLVASPVSAQPAPTSDGEPGPTSTSVMTRQEKLRQMSCRTMPAEFQKDCLTDGSDATKSSPSGWQFFFAAVVWVFIPMMLAVGIAGRRDESVVIAVVLTLILGWIGFVLVYVFLGSRRPDAATVRPSP